MASITAKENNSTSNFGPKTIFFWAPSFKWGLVIAGIADIARPAEKLSPPQSTALAATGFIWARWSLIILPRIWPYFVCNIFVGCTGLFQMGRIFKFYMGTMVFDYYTKNLGSQSV